VMEKIEECVKAFFVACSFKNVKDNFEWALATDYGPNVDSDIRLLWDKLVGTMSRWNISLSIGGDYQLNINRFQSERFSGVMASPAMLDISKFIFGLGL
jgi:hypothetical protein